MEPRDPPPTDEGWYALHDFRQIDWDAWHDAPERSRKAALAEITDHLEACLAVSDADEGASALYSVLGHKADILLLHLRPTTAHLGALERQFESTVFGSFTERTDSFVSVTEASGYSEAARGYFLEGEEVNPGLQNYIQTRLKPQIPDATHVCFYPMNKRRDPGQNWYDLPFDERAEHMEAHGDIGRKYGGKVVQMITGAIALDDWEWGVTLWGDDLVDMKDLLYEMRFDPSTSQFAEFGPFMIGRRFPPSDLPAFLAGAPVPTAEHESDLDAVIHPEDATTEHDGDGEGTAGEDVAAEPEAVADGDGESDGRDNEEDSDTGLPDSDVPDEVETIEDDDLITRLGTLGLHEGEDYPGGSHGIVVYSSADAQQLADEVDGLRGNFDHYDSHVLTSVRAASGESAVVSVWETDRAAGIAEGFLTQLSGVSQSVRGALGEPSESESEHEAKTDDIAGSEASPASESQSMREALAELDVYAGKPHGEDIYALVLYSDAPLSELVDEVDELAAGFDRYDTHEGTTVYDDPDSDTAAVVSLWETEKAAGIASEHLTGLPDVIGWADEAEGFGTMGMFYTVKPEYREEFVETFGEVGELLNEMEGHRGTALLANTENPNDMFIASQWNSKADAMEFFRSDAFSETVQWGREVLADRPRHVFLA